MSLDGATWTASNGATYHLYHMRDEASAFHLAKACPRRDIDAVIHALKSPWLHWAGPCKELWFDDAPEFSSEALATFLQSQSIRHRMIATDARWQLGRAERHGGVLQTKLDKFETELPITDLASLQEALVACCTAKNQLSQVYGYTPEILDLGKSAVSPGSMVSDESCMAHSLVVHDGAEGLTLKDNLLRREIAHRSYIAADNSDSLRRAALRRSRPLRETFQCGDSVMLGKVDVGCTKGRRHGPGRVLSQDHNQVVWISQLSRLFRVSPEHVRMATSEELQGPVMESWHDIRRKLQYTSGPHQFLDLSQSADPMGSADSMSRIPLASLDPVSSSSRTEPVTARESDIAPPAPVTAESVPAESAADMQPDAEPTALSSEAADSSRRSSLGPEFSSIPPPGIPLPEQVPVHTDTDDELFMIEDPLQLQCNACWVCEVFVTDADSSQWRQAPILKTWPLLLRLQAIAC